jgi:hypothetical protein
MMNIHEVDENVSASALPPLGAAELYDIRMIYCGNSFFDRTAKQKGKQ